MALDHGLMSGPQRERIPVQRPLVHAPLQQLLQVRHLAPRALATCLPHAILAVPRRPPRCFPAVPFPDVLSLARSLLQVRPREQPPQVRLRARLPQLHVSAQASQVRVGLRFPWCPSLVLPPDRIPHLVQAFPIELDPACVAHGEAIASGPGVGYVAATFRISSCRVLSCLVFFHLILSHLILETIHLISSHLINDPSPCTKFIGALCTSSRFVQSLSGRLVLPQVRGECITSCCPKYEVAHVTLFPPGYKVTCAPRAILRHEAVCAPRTQLHKAVCAPRTQLYKAVCAPRTRLYKVVCASRSCLNTQRDVCTLFTLEHEVVCALYSPRERGCLCTSCSLVQIPKILFLI